MKPLFKHDCDSCIYVKTAKDDFGTLADMYVCGNSVIFRYGDEPSNNRSVCFDEKDEQLAKHFQPFYDILRDFKKNKIKTIR
jgi:hypothetical protein